MQYTIVRLAGTLQNQPLGEFARFEVAPLAALPNPTPFERDQDAHVVLDRQQIKRFEDARAGGDARFQIMFSCLVWYPLGQKFEVSRSSGHLDVVVPSSHWTHQVVGRWNLSSIKLLEIRFPTGSTGENFSASYARVQEAERLFASGHYKQALTTLRLSFEGLAKSFGFEKAG